MRAFGHILEWTLKKGSHEFPGPDGGTCINEAALVAAGFDYRPIARVQEMPACFSRPICHFAQWLNDTASDHERQFLLRFVARLACADDDFDVERLRATYIDLRRPILSIEMGIEVLEGALAIGRRAAPLTAETVRERMDAVRRKTLTSA